MKLLPKSCDGVSGAHPMPELQPVGSPRSKSLSEVEWFEWNYLERFSALYGGGCAFLALPFIFSRGACAARVLTSQYFSPRLRPTMRLPSCGNHFSHFPTFLRSRNKGAFSVYYGYAWIVKGHSAKMVIYDATCQMDLAWVIFEKSRTAFCNPGLRWWAINGTCNHWRNTAATSRVISFFLSRSSCNNLALTLFLDIQITWKHY